MKENIRIQHHKKIKITSTMEKALIVSASSLGLVFCILNHYKITSIQTYQRIYDNYVQTMQKVEGKQSMQDQLNQWAEIHKTIDTQKIGEKGIGLTVEGYLIKAWKGKPTIEYVRSKGSYVVEVGITVETTVQHAYNQTQKVMPLTYSYEGEWESDEEKILIETLEPAMKFNWGHGEKMNTSWIHADYES